MMDGKLSGFPSFFILSHERRSGLLSRKKK